MADPVPALSDHALFSSRNEADPRSPEARAIEHDLTEALGRRLVTARELARRRAADPVQIELLPTGLEALDRLLSGGVPRGDVVEIRGTRSSGRFSCVQALLATTLATGEVAALVDLGDQLSPEQAREYGIDLERLLWVRPQHLREALSAAEILLSSRFPLVVLDLGTPPVPGGRGAEASWLRLARAARRDDGALVVASPYRVTGTAAAEVIDLGPGTFRWRYADASPALPAGLTVRAERVKSRRDPRIERAELTLWTPEEAGMYLGPPSRSARTRAGRSAAGGILDAVQRSRCPPFPHPEPFEGSREPGDATAPFMTRAYLGPLRPTADRPARVRALRDGESSTTRNS